MDSYKYLDQTKFASSAGAFMLHLHMRTIPHMRKKVVNRGIAAEAANTGIAPHWKGWARDYNNRGDEALIDLIKNYHRGLS
jgi:hypothetical protein